jgi:hypothetical protein
MLPPTPVRPKPDAPPTTDASFSLVEEELPPARWSPTPHWPHVPRRWKTQPWHWALGGLTVLALVAALVVGFHTEPGATSPQRTATSAPKQWVVTQKVTGAINRQTGVFRVADGERLEWAVAPTTSPANFCSMTLHARDGTVLAVVADAAYLSSGKAGRYIIHGAGEVYLEIKVLNAKYTVTLEALE